MKSEHEHIQKINDLMLYIDLNLEKELVIDDLASIACLSKFYLNRLFKFHTGESIYQYIKRLRIERAFYYLWNEEIPIKVAAIRCGFNSMSNFSSCYKKYFGITPKEQKLANIESKKNENNYNDTSGFSAGTKKSKKMCLAYIKHIGSYHMDTLDCERRLFEWIDSKGLWNDNSHFIRLNYDSMYVTKEKHFRTDICIEVPEGNEASEGICIMEYPERTFAYLKRTGTATKEFIRDSAGDLHHWMLNNGYTNTENSPSMIIHKRRCINNINDRFNEELDFEFCFSVKPL